MDSNSEREDRISQLSNLPTLPQVAARLMSAIRDSSASAPEIAGLIAQDPSLTAKTLRMANSAFYGIPRTVTNITNAVVILGMKVMSTLVLSATVFDMFPDEKRSKLFDRRAFWLHSIACGLLAKRLAAHVRKSSILDPEEVFCSGLLHDIGKVVMDQYLHLEFQTALTVAHDTQSCVVDAERSRLGYDHTDVARWLMARWELPPELIFAPIHHHSPLDAGEYTDAVSLCHIADVLSYQEGYSPTPHLAPPQMDQQVLKYLKLTPDDLHSVSLAFKNDVQHVTMFVEAL